MKRIGLGIPAFAACIGFFLISACAGSPAVVIKVSRVPTMNTTGIQRIAIQPFTASDRSDAQRQIAAAITTEVTRRIQETGQFTLVDYREVERLQKAGENIENYIDALFVGQVVSLNTGDSRREVEMLNPLTFKTERVTMYTRRAELSFSYSFQRARDGSLVGVVTKRGIAEDEQTSRGDLKSADQLLQMIVVHRLQALARDVAPWTETRNVRLMPPGKRASKETVKQMNEALDYVKEGSYKRALGIYEAIYAGMGSFEAGYNITLLYEATGDIDSARQIALELVEETGNPKAQERLAEINKIIADQAAIAGDYSDTRSQFDKVMEAAIPLVMDRLPRRMTVAVQNTSNSADRSLAERAVNSIMDALREAGVTLVDRSNQRLLDAERSMQSDNWEDFDESTIAGFGQQAGVQVFVLVTISGTSNARMLQVRLLDVASQEIIYQTPASAQMRL